MFSELNFKKFDKINYLTHFNLFSGRNGSGKTTLLNNIKLKYYISLFSHGDCIYIQDNHLYNQDNYYNLEFFIRNVLTYTDKEKYIDTLNNILHIKNIYFENGQIYFDKGKIIVTKLSDGEQKILLLLSILFYVTNDSLILIDDIDNSIDSRLYEDLLKVLQKVIFIKNLTFFITTHSKEFIESVAKNIQVVSYYRLENDGKTIKNFYFSDQDFKTAVLKDNFDVR